MQSILTENPGGISIGKLVPSLIPFESTQGIFLKLASNDSNWEVMNDWGYGSYTRDTWDDRIAEIKAVNGGKGFHLDVPWGLYEKGASGGDFSNLHFLKTIADEAYAEGLYLFLDPMIFREFRSSAVSSLALDLQMRYLLPTDMWTHQGLIDTPDVPAAQAHYRWDYAYAYDKSSGANFGYDIKAYNTTLQTRFIRFARAVCDVLGNHPAVIGITSTESVDGTPVWTGAGGFEGGFPTRQAYFAGKTTIMWAVNGMFKRHMVAQSVNYPNEGTAVTDPIDYVGDWHAFAQTEKFSLTAPNAQWWSTSLNRVGSGSSPKGGNRYFTDFTGPRIVQWQGDEFDSSVNGSPAISTTADYTQRYADLYTRSTVGDGASKFALNATHIIVQRTMAPEIWLGGTTSGVPNVPNGVTVPSLSAFLNNSAYIPQDGKAGLGSQTVSYFT